VDWVVFEADLIAYAFVVVSLSDAKFMGGEYLNESRNCDLLMFALVNLLVFAALFNTQKKAYLKGGVSHTVSANLMLTLSTYRVV